ncbi:ectoine hydroxylase-related dioxygenase (phytanoyl-CoA dioxygenase family) [Lewinella marina]|uniref:Phytanoyl-CoA dioxygenase family protein n=1 Tax=Neolewinella marina TaxID=438751 RepID=A0A2G0CFK8_9BACT|nr:phytanoyl-CoA dioxygenase family protein [Neolewinella marina]NJB85618.1 ectoine hydroxylase-related dioxygenase (phytanoyl-CoA dioxygenase family) [Neolewinella marina]PHK98697.1 phytanoyl-CoA dioxygenase family protein [Neolewinella marina]
MSQRDLSQYAAPISDLFPPLSAEEAWERYALSNEQVDFFHEHGYLSKVKLLEEEEVGRLREELEALVQPDHPGNHLFYEYHSNESGDPDAVLFHSLGHWRITPGFHDVLWNPRFLVAASQLLGNRAVRFWHDQLFCKPARHGGVVAWHQDYSYWTRTGPIQHLTCWTALDDATPENGCLQYVPGSHRWKLLDKTTLANDMEGLYAQLDAEQRRAFDQRVAVELPAGYATFHHPLLVHGSYHNRSERARRAFVLNVFADGTRSNVTEELLKGVPVVPKGERMEGRFFPLLFTPPAGAQAQS